MTMTRRQLGRLSRHLLSWTAPPGVALQVTLIPAHGAATAGLVGAGGAMSLMTFRVPLSRREAHRALDATAADLTACSCPFCRSQSAALSQAMQAVPRNRIDPTGFSHAN